MRQWFEWKYIKLVNSWSVKEELILKWMKRMNGKWKDGEMCIYNVKPSYKKWKILS